ncbi:DUF935 domain-containing protein [Rhizobium sp. Leaf341]|uniref:DUF935 domain-containing protein n=1 Tax=Rhizobium sp. Leaf341 TaxID=1736344 RepID=UPI0007159141|nr:DUF935 family protein [Rhizobium sp. Leaf341]KQR75759.1 hypothetical protein ASG03_18990 [Rhizobium sp. Leaf341]
MADTTMEIATIRTDPFVPEFAGVMHPTDEILRTRGLGKGHQLYDEIRRDPHAFAILQKRKLEVVSREWNVFEVSESDLDKRAAAEVTRQLKAIDFDKLTRGLMGAVLKGFSVAEVLWANVAGVWTLQAVKVKKQRRFRFDMDGQLRLLTRSAMVEGVPVPDRKFVVHRHSIDDDEDDPYGIGLGSVLYWPAWMKRNALAQWLRAVEKHGTPTTKIIYPGGYDKQRQDEMLEAIRQLANDTGIAVPENVIVELLEAKAGGGDVFEKLNRYLDELMSEAVLGETLTTNSGERGARSLGEVHNEVRVAIAKADADLISATIKDTIVRWIVELNFPGAGVPNVWRDFAEAEDLNEKIKCDETIFKMGYRPKDPQYIDDTYGGEWIEKPEPETKPPVPGSPGKGALDNLDFADPPTRSNSERVVENLTDQLETAGAGVFDSMIGQIRTEFAEARDYDDLTLRLARLSSEMGVDDLAQLLEQAAMLAQLEGVASVDGR